MIGSHPGGTALTERLLALWEQESLREGCQETKQRTRQKTEPGIKQGMQQKIQVLDLGAGDGSSLAYLKQHGYEARGIDREPKNEAVERQDMTRLSFPISSFFCFPLFFQKFLQIQGFLFPAGRFMERIKAFVSGLTR